MISRPSNQNSPRSAFGHGGRSMRSQSARYEEVLQNLRGALDADNFCGYAVGVTSCRARIGVSTLVVNLAITSAQIDDRPSLIIDANCVQPAVHKLLGMELGAGLSNIASGQQCVSELMRNTKVPNLSVISAGSSPASQPPLAQHAWSELLEDLRGQFGWIFVDLPAPRGGRGLPLAAPLDGVLLLVEAERTTRSRVQQVRHNLLRGGASVLGAVVRTVA